MRWNPAISSYKLEVYHRNCEEFPDGLRIDWSIWDYQEAQIDDNFVMMRVGDYKPGIVFFGKFVSDPYVDDDWAGSDKKRQYVLMDCFGFKEDDEPLISPAALYEVMPEIDWLHGHSGVVLADNIAERLHDMLSELLPGFSFNPDTPANGSIEYEAFEASDYLSELMRKFEYLSPSIHSREEEGYDWLESDDDWSRCLLIPNPNSGGQSIEIETCGEFVLYFAGSHAHYFGEKEGYEELIEDISNIIEGKMCAYSCKYEDWLCCGGLTCLRPLQEDVKEYLRSDNEYDIRMLANYIEKDVKKDGIYKIDLRFFDPKMNATFSFRLDELSDKIDEYRKIQEQTKKECSDFS